MLTLSNIIIIIVDIIESLFILVLFSETCARQQDSIRATVINLSEQVTVTRLKSV